MLRIRKTHVVLKGRNSLLVASQPVIRGGGGGFKGELLSVHKIDISTDNALAHPQYICVVEWTNGCA